MLLTALLFSIRRYPRVGNFSFFHPFHQGKIKASLIFFLSSACFTESPLEIGTVVRESRRLYHLSTPRSPTTHTHSHTHRPFFPQTSRSTILPFASHGPWQACLHYRDARGQGGWAGQGGKLCTFYPPPADICSWPCVNHPSTSPPHCLS